MGGADVNKRLVVLRSVTFAYERPRISDKKKEVGV